MYKNTNNPFIPSVYSNTHFIQRGFGYQNNQGRIITRGRGIGSLLFKTFQFLTPLITPLLKKTARSLGSEALTTSQNILNRLDSNANMKDIIFEEGKRGIQNLKEKVEKKVKEMSGEGLRRKKRSINRRKKIQLAFIPSPPKEKNVKKKKTVVKKKRTIKKNSKKNKSTLF